MLVMILIISVVLFMMCVFVANIINAKKCKIKTQFRLIWCMFNCISLALSVLYSVDFISQWLMLGWIIYIGYELNKVKVACNLRTCQLFSSEPCKARREHG